MSASDLRSEGEADGEENADVDNDVLAGELAVLREENERLRQEYARARQSQYRQSAATLVVIGVLAFLAGIVVVDARTVLFALGGTGVFLGVLIYFLTPERFISASVGEAVYASVAHNGSRVVTELGLEDEWVYAPLDRDGPAETSSVVRLFVPHHADYEVPDDKALDDLFVMTEDGRRRGMAFRPTAADLYANFEQAVTGEPSTEVDALAAELSDALVEQFELVESTQVDHDAGDGRTVVRVSGNAIGRPDRFDHPVTSLLGVGFARAVGRPVTVDVTTADETGEEFVITCSWTTKS